MFQKIRKKKQRTEKNLKLVCLHCTLNLNTQKTGLRTYMSFSFNTFVVSKKKTSSLKSNDLILN